METLPTNEHAASPGVPPPAAGWPGLVFWIGGGIFRALGYFSLVLAGICIARKDPFGVMLFELAMGHLLICAAEVIDEMNEKRKRSASANAMITNSRAQK